MANLGKIEVGQEFDEDGDLLLFCKSFVKKQCAEIYLDKEEALELLEQLEELLYPQEV